MENKKPYTKRENRYFQINCGIKNCFLSLIAIVSKHIVKVLEKSTKELFMEKLYA